MSFERRELGQLGEKAACKALKRAGYKIAERNFRSIFGEIDIVAMDGSVLVFIEVKTRTSATFGTPKDAVDRRKQRKIVKISMDYIAKRWRGAEPQVRYDVVGVEVVEAEAGGLKSEIIKDAFSADGLV